MPEWERACAPERVRASKEKLQPGPRRPFWPRLWKLLLPPQPDPGFARPSQGAPRAGNAAPGACGGPSGGRRDSSQATARGPENAAICPHFHSRLPDPPSPLRRRRKGSGSSGTGSCSAFGPGGRTAAEGRWAWSGARGVSPPRLVCWNAPPKRAREVRLCRGIGVTFLPPPRALLVCPPGVAGPTRERTPRRVHLARPERSNTVPGVNNVTL